MFSFLAAVVAKWVKPTSIPIAFSSLTGLALGDFFSHSQEKETNQPSPSCTIVVSLIVPSISLDLRNFTQPIFGKKTWDPSILTPCGKRKLSASPFFLNRG